MDILILVTIAAGGIAIFQLARTVMKPKPRGCPTCGGRLIRASASGLDGNGPKVWVCERCHGA